MQRFEHPDDIPHLLRHRYIADIFDKERNQQMAVELGKPENTLVFVTSKSFDVESLPKKEKWYKIDYSSDKYSQELFASLQNPNVKENGLRLDLPPQNNLLPKNFDILPEDTQLSSRMQLLKTWDDTEVWYKKDDKFKRPKGIVNFKIYTNDCDFSQTAAGRLFGEVWRQCLDEYLREFAYMASCASLDFSLSILADNVEFSWSGFNDSLPTYVTETVKKIKGMKSADLEEIFNQKKESLLQEYKNHYLQQTFRLAWGATTYHL